MSTTLDCASVEERLSEFHEGLLDDHARAEVERHLAGCTRCAALLAALGEVMAALRASPELEPARDLAERAATAALHAKAPSARFAPARLLRFPRVAAAGRDLFASSVPMVVRGLAAALALALTAGMLLLHSFMGPPARAASRVVERTVNAGAYLAERKDRLVEDFRILRVVIGTAFEGRLDRVNDRVDDYRRLLERRRNTPSLPAAPDAKAPAAQDGVAPETGDRRDASHGPAVSVQFVNFRLAAAVERGVTREATRRTTRPLMRSCARRTA
jgi:hypothetical protein